MTKLFSSTSSLDEAIKAFDSGNDVKIIKAIVGKMALYKYCGIFRAKQGANIKCGSQGNYYAEVYDGWTWFYPEDYGDLNTKKFRYPKFILLYDIKTGELVKEIEVEDILEQFLNTHNLLRS